MTAISHKIQLQAVTCIIFMAMAPLGCAPLPPGPIPKTLSQASNVNIKRETFWRHDRIIMHLQTLPDRNNPQVLVLAGLVGSIIDSSGQQVTKEFPIPHRYITTELIRLKNEYMLMSHGEGFSKLLVMSLSGAVVWQHEKTNQVSVAALMKSGDLNKDGIPEFYVATLQGASGVQVLNENGQLIREFAPKGAWPMTVTTDYVVTGRRPNEIDFWSSKGDLVRTIKTPSSYAFRTFITLNWPHEGDFAGLSREGRLYIFSGNGEILFSKEIGGSGIYATSFTSSGERYLALLQRLPSRYTDGYLYILNTKFDILYKERVQNSFAIAPFDSESFLVGQGNEVIRYRISGK